MIARVMRHHPLWGGMPKLSGIALAVASVVGNVLVFSVLRHGKEGPAYEGSLLWMELALLGLAVVGILLHKVQLRANSWFLGLPIDARLLWRGHYFVVLSCLLLLILVQWLVILLFLYLMEGITDRLIIEKSRILLTLISPSLLAIFLAAMIAAFQPALSDLSSSARWKRYRQILVGVSLLLLVLLSFVPPVWGLVPAVVGVLIARRACRSLPQGLVLGRGVSQADGGGKEVAWSSQAGEEQRAGGMRKTIPISLLNELFKVPYPYTAIMALFVAFFTIMMSGASPMGERVYGETIRLAQYGLTIYLMVALAGEFLQRLHKIDSLPVDRRKLLIYLCAPLAVGAIGGYAGGRIWVNLKEYPEERVHFQDSYGMYGAAVSPTYSELARRGEESEVVAPWGETHTTAARHPVVFPGSPLAAGTATLTVGGKTSRAFLAWQLSNAVERVYGVSIPPDTLDARYMQIDEEGNPFIPRRAFTVAADFGLKPLSGGPVAPLILTPLFVGWFLVKGFFFWLHRSLMSVKRSRVIWGVMMVLLFAWHFLLTFRWVPLVNEWGLAVLVFSSARELGEWGLQGHVLSYGIGLLLVLASWRFCCRMFMKVEAPRN